MNSPQMQNLLARYRASTRDELLQAIADEYTDMCCDPGDEPFLARDMEGQLDQMLEAEYQRIEGGAYDPVDEDEDEPVGLYSTPVYDADAAYELWLETRFSD